MSTARTLALRAQETYQRYATLIDAAKTILFVYTLLAQTVQMRRHLRARGLRQTLREMWTWMFQRAFLLALRLPAARKRVEAELGEVRREIESKLVPSGPDVSRHLALPPAGRSPEWILKEMEKMDKEGGKQDSWKDGRLSGAVYHGGDDMEEIIVSAFRRYVVSNPLHPDAFPAVRKMEAEVVSMCLRIYNNPTGAGTMTSGGTESIVMAVKTHRDWARDVKGIKEPEMVVPISAHAAFDKAAEYLKIKIHTIPVDPETRKVDLSRVRRAINSNTIMIVGSAVNFPDGCMDDIPMLSEIAKRHRIGLHVDCCLGSFIMPFLERAGFPCDLFDFRLPGVTSISCDTHKYGFAPKGSSVIMYRTAELRRYQYYITTGWPGGLYGSPSLAGSRPGALIAGTWAAMQYMGEDGYTASAKAIVGCAQRIVARVRAEIPELRVLGAPPGPCVAFAAALVPASSGSESGSASGSGVRSIRGAREAVNVLAVGDAMAKRGWHLNGLSGPPAVHIACTRLTVPVSEDFVSDLKACVAEVKAAEALAKEKGEKGKEGNMVALYGLGHSSAVGPALLEKVTEIFLDTMYKA